MEDIMLRERTTGSDAETNAYLKEEVITLNKINASLKQNQLKYGYIYIIVLMILLVVSNVVFYAVFIRPYLDKEKEPASQEKAGASGASPLSPFIQSLPQAAPQSQGTKNNKYYFNIGMRNDYLLQECQGPYLKRSFPDIDYAFLGYNILKGYPLSVGHDPGFTLPIFSADYSTGGQTADCRFSVPKGIIVIPDVSCITSFSSNVVQTKYEFSKALSTSASVSGGGWGVSFSASAGYKESTSQMASGESVFIISRASCNYYYIRLLEDDSPGFHPIFKKWILKLNRTDPQQSQKEKDTYMDFFNRFGTHFVREAKYGASFTYEHKMSVSDYKREIDKGVNIRVAASYSGLFSVGGGFNFDSSQKEKASNFQKKVETRTITIGAPPPANGDYMTWASTVKESPVPVTYVLASIEDLFSESFFSENRMPNINYLKISENIKLMKAEFCLQLKKEGLADDCSELTPGVNLKDTALYIRRVPLQRKKVSSNGDCIDACFQSETCIAVTYCVKCKSYASNYNSCNMVQDGSIHGATKREGYDTNIILQEVDKTITMYGTGVKGIERAITNSTGIVDPSGCLYKCIEDMFCVAFTFSRNPTEKQNCRLYSDRSMSLFKKPYSITYFVSPRVKHAYEVATTTTPT